ncbi:enoyl-CoA hydratase-related protein, partial [Enterobacter hormaechei]
TPTVAAVQGRCIGGAVDLISACDVRHGAADSSYSIREVKVGIVADMGSLARLPHIIGQGLTRELALTGRDIDAETALR